MIDWLMGQTEAFLIVLTPQEHTIACLRDSIYGCRAGAKPQVGRLEFAEAEHVFHFLAHGKAQRWHLFLLLSMLWHRRHRMGHAFAAPMLGPTQEILGLRNAACSWKKSSRDKLFTK